MPYVELIWVEGPYGNIEHIAGNDITPDEVEQVLRNPVGESTSRSSGRQIVYGYTNRGRYLLVAFEPVDDITVYPVTAYEVEK